MVNIDTGWSGRPNMGGSEEPRRDAPGCAVAGVEGKVSHQQQRTVENDPFAAMSALQADVHCLAGMP
jgi:hypothetical protein